MQPLFVFGASCCGGPTGALSQLEAAGGWDKAGATDWVDSSGEADCALASTDAPQRVQKST
jgi:hypothetical protein